jgi:2-keto-4-pentenoate hydratase
MTDQHWNTASDMLWEFWNGGRCMKALPETIRPRTRQDGYAIQASIERRTTLPLFGWKIAATSKAGQAHIRVDGPIAGRLLRERARESGASVPLGHNRMRVAEAEFAFRFGAHLPPRKTAYPTSEVLEAVATLHPAIEIPDSRYEDFTLVGAPQLIADNACAHDFVLGGAAPDPWRAMDLVSHPVRARIEGKLEREGSGANVLGDPREALAWLVNEVSGLGITLRAGQVVTTGTCLTPLPIESGDYVIADFGELGSVEVQMIE